jgi:sulfate transporter 4
VTHTSVQQHSCRQPNVSSQLPPPRLTKPPSPHPTAGLPHFTAGWWFPLISATPQLTLAALICIIDIVESISIAKALAAKNKYQLNATQELQGEGAGNGPPPPPPLPSRSPLPTPPPPHPHTHTLARALRPDTRPAGLGFANVAGAMFNAYTTTGSFSRSAVNNSVGAKTPLAGFITGVILMLTLLYITPVFTNMSYNVLVSVRAGGRGRWWGG